MEGQSGWVKDLIRDIPDFPRPGVSFKDITPLLADPKAFGRTVDAMTEPFRGRTIDKVIGIEARGFIIAAPVALDLHAGFVPVRKKGKLPWRVHAETYDLEYGTDTLEVHVDAITPGDRILIVDDVLATGGTAGAVANMVAHMGGVAVGYSFILELGFLGGRSRTGDLDTFSLVTYE
ncbi:MAG TPA: adenine phosphoribosyltransferase [Acidimicrobiales bacterium]|jgi:adenine phosphoribosyltransferase|nr:adenine phosphoribosyltransferase [Acidimicrobiales bacterium]